ncbi:Pancreatic lipase 2, partial [Operophtera brumata]
MKDTIDRLDSDMEFSVIDVKEIEKTVASMTTYLGAADVNVIVVDWSAGAGTINYAAAVVNTVTSGESVARFISWLNAVSGASLSSYHIAGHSLGGHQAGIVGRNLGGQVSYITYHIAGHSLGGHQAGIVGRNLVGQVSYITCKYLTTSRVQPRRAPGRHSGQEPGRTGLLHHVQSDGIHTEVIHTNAGISGFLTPLGDVDFYPNGGVNMPGCNGQNCDHDRAFYYFAESLSSGGFSGTRCSTYIAAINGD